MPHADRQIPWASSRNAYPAPRRAPPIVMAIIDPSADERPCIEKAARLAAAWGGTLELHGTDAQWDIPESWAGGDASAQYRRLMHSRYTDELAALAAGLRHQGLKVATASEWGENAESVEHRLLRTPATLVIKSVSPARSLSAADWLVARTGAALLLVSRAPWPASPRVAIPAGVGIAAEREGRMLALALAGETEVAHARSSVPPPHVLILDASDGAVTAAQPLSQAPCDVMIVSARRATFAPSAGN